MEEDIEKINELQKEIASSFQTSKARKGFVERNLEVLKWSIIVYHLFFAIWALYIFLNKVLPAISGLIYFIPLLLFISTSVIGSYLLLKNKTNSYNYLIVAQIPQIIILQLNGFAYFLLIGQWMILRVGGGQLLGINFGLLDAKYTFLFGNATEIGFLIGINILPIILIFILLKMEEMNKAINNSITTDSKI